MVTQRRLALDARVDARRAFLGAQGEDVGARLLRANGYRVERANERRCGDLIVTDARTGERFFVEVKASTRGQNRSWRFTLLKAGHTDHRNTDYVLLLAFIERGAVVPFLIPTKDIQQKHHIHISSHPLHYQGQYVAYRRMGVLVLGLPAL